MEPDQIDILSFTVLGNFKQIEHTQEAGLSRQLRRDIGKPDLRDRVYLDLPFFHPVPATHFDVGMRPYSNAASDFSPTNSIAQMPGEDHDQSLRPAEDGRAVEIT